MIKGCQVTCECPPTCTTNADCGANELCRFGTFGCGGGSKIGFCDGRPDPITCGTGGPVCGCDGEVYESRCAASVAGTAITDAPGTDCDAERVPCTDDPNGLRCFVANEWCALQSPESSFPDTCQRFGGTVTPCSTLDCDCLDKIAQEQSAQTCTCSVLPSGLHVVACH